MTARVGVSHKAPASDAPQTVAVRCHCPKPAIWCGAKLLPAIESTFVLQVACVNGTKRLQLQRPHERQQIESTFAELGACKWKLAIGQRVAFGVRIFLSLSHTHEHSRHISRGQLIQMTQESPICKRLVGSISSDLIARRNSTRPRPAQLVCAVYI